MRGNSRRHKENGRTTTAPGPARFWMAASGTCAMPNFVMTPREVADLAKMPSRDELLAKLMGTLQAPVAKFVRTLNEVPAKFVRTVAAVRDQREKTAA